MNARDFLTLTVVPGDPDTRGGRNSLIAALEIVVPGHKSPLIQSRRNEAGIASTPVFWRDTPGQRNVSKHDRRDCRANAPEWLNFGASLRMNGRRGNLTE